MPRRLRPLLPAILLTSVLHAQPDLPRRHFRAWAGFAANAQHNAVSTVRSQSIQRIHWQTTIDFAPVFQGDTLQMHYGSPLITARNTVIAPVKTGPDGGFRVDALSARDGKQLWSLSTDYILPPHSWVPVFEPAIAGSRVYFAGAGGTVYYRDDADAATGATGQLAFYGLDEYRAHRSEYDNAIRINTPLTTGADGNIYFAFQAIADNPLHLSSGIVRIDADGSATWTPVTTAAGDATVTHVVQNCAPALSLDGATLYLAVKDADLAGYLLALDSATLARRAAMRLKDPATGNDAVLFDNGTASPMIGPDGDVYFGVYESDGENNDRGWLLHFNASLANAKTPGAFGWDDTPSLVPAWMVRSYSGTSSYLLMTKYNNYAETGGDGMNRIAVLDPFASEPDAITGAVVMKEVVTILGPTPDDDFPGVKEWCINSAAVDPASGSVIVTSEDGHVYRWDLNANRFSESLMLTAGVPEPYTPTAIGPDGTIYAINNSQLFAIGQ